MMGTPTHPGIMISTLRTVRKEMKSTLSHSEITARLAFYRNICLDDTGLLEKEFYFMFVSDTHTHAFWFSNSLSLTHTHTTHIHNRMWKPQSRVTWACERQRVRLDRWANRWQVQGRHLQKVTPRLKLFINLVFISVVLWLRLQFHIIPAPQCAYAGVNRSRCSKTRPASVSIRFP